MALLRFKKGSKVEVLNKREVPSGSWWCAEIISGNGHTYSVRYDQYLPDMDGAVERVPRKAIRPRPPPVKVPRSWVAGDIVEVFDNNSWKLAEVSKVVARDFYFVRLLGSFREFRVHISDLRVRQSWQDNKWVVIQKESGRCNDGLMNSQTKIVKFSSQLPQSCIELEKYGVDEQICVENNNGYAEPTSRSMKKRSLPVDTCTGTNRKMRAVQKEGKHQQIIGRHSSQLLEKVDAVASPRKMLGEKYMHASLNHRIYEMGSDKQKPLADVGYRFIGSVGPNDAESVSSSVGSCSPSKSLYRSFHYPIASPPQGLDNHFDDADSSCVSGRDFPLHAKKALEEEIHHLELHAYHSTMLALYASGPLSWEKEALMTNLRLMLHISNDEHLLELRAKVGMLI
ncbi:uncharacterized protein [Elaeis guineensis]|uniref:Uncharacterized protein LOC105043194 isoform X2 n=1 Tax=Elaeis guineensis var. tenera TaxID=51953 RepID=A0A8N4F0B2_ELAGV|nr:uncharacterized protein LOC105043194 isoform X2 [Elaeis guineensis]